MVKRGFLAVLAVLLESAMASASVELPTCEIVYCTRAQYAPDHHNTATMFQCGECNYLSYKTQGALKAFDPRTGRTRVIVPEKPGRTVRDPEVDYDGRRIVFSMRCSSNENYHVWTVNADGSDLRRLTSHPEATDIDPTWLPDGDILFSSTREPKYCMCATHIMCNLYRMKPDGANIHQIGRSTLFEGHGSVMEDGRVLYDRWEYVDRNFGDAQGLWVCNPDGTGHAIYWGNNTTSPGGVINARQIPGNISQAIAVLTACHDRPWGALGIIDRTKGVDGREPVLRTWPADFRNRIHANGKEEFDTPKSLSVKYADPYPIDARRFLATRQTGRGEEMAIVYLDLDGNEVVLKEESPGCHTPVLLRPRPRPPVIPRRRHFADPHAVGRYYLQNVYEGTHMQGVASGTIKAIRVVESPEKRNYNGWWCWYGQGAMTPAMNWHSFENKRILGTVPVEEDGSAYFEVPANRFVYFQALDAEGKMVQSMRSGTFLQPGETYGCIGCHENRIETSRFAGRTVRALMRPPSKLDGSWNQRGLKKGSKPELFSFQKEVQPVFTKSCLGCHDLGGSASKKLILAGDRSFYFSLSYTWLWAKRLITCVGAGPSETQQPYSWGSHASKLTRMLYGHGGVELADDDRDRIITWMDVNAPYYPDYDTAVGYERFVPGGRSPVDKTAQDTIEKLTGCKVGKSAGDSFPDMFSFDRPEQSPGLDTIRNRPEKKTDYEKAVSILKLGNTVLKQRPRGDVLEDFVPCGEDARRQERYARMEKQEVEVYKAIRADECLYDDRLAVLTPPVAGWTVLVNGRQLPLRRASFGYAYGAFDLTERVSVCVRNVKALDHVTVKPLKFGMEMKKNGANELWFETDRPFRLSFENGSRKDVLHLFGDPPERDRPQKGAPNVKWYGPGEHSAGLIVLRTGETLYLERGAVVHGAIKATGDDITVCGRGILTGERYPHTNGPGLFFAHFLDGRRIRVRDVTLAESYHWTLVPHNCEDVTIENVKILCSRVINDDGLDLLNCRRVTIRDTFIRSNDDCFCLKGFGNGYDDVPCADTLLENCEFWCDEANVMRIGWECGCRSFERLTVRDCDTLRFSPHKDDPRKTWSHAIIWLQVSNGVRMGDFSFDRFRVYSDGEDITYLIANPRLCHHHVGEAYYKKESKLVRYTKGGMIENVAFDNCEVLGEKGSFKGEIFLAGRTPEEPVRKFRFRNFRFLGKEVSERDQQVKIGPHTSDIQFENVKP